jgi:phosphomannomutase
VTESPAGADRLLERAQAWLAGDPDPDDRAELAALVASARSDPGSPAWAELSDRLAGPLRFGTAGLRGPMGAGPKRMNRAVVMRAARGLSDYLTDRLAESAAAQLNGPLAGQPPRVVIGYDARHRSRQFALDSAAVLTAAGALVWLFPEPVPTPLLAYAVRALAAEAGVQVTASHNPAADNGYKVYLGGRMTAEPARGVQIVPPQDDDIAARIEAAGPAAAIPRADSGWSAVEPELAQAYVAAVAAGPVNRTPLKIVHTACHGLATPWLTQIMGRAGFDQVVSVASQAQPDPDFPTLAFPNPEEPGALDAALAQAAAVGADLVIAHDPDADRCAVAVPCRQGGWRALRGDELGALLGQERAVELAARLGRGQTGQPADSPRLLASTIVSSRLLGRIASSHGLEHRVTLTGFKWLARLPGLAFAYEEAIGYCLRPDLVRDKDGLSAALAVARLAARLKEEGRDLLDALDDLARAHGLYLTDQLSLRSQDPVWRDRAMAALRRRPPAELADSPVTGLTDLALDSDQWPPTDALVLTTAADDRVVVRPSGTEPKLKCYLEVVHPVDRSAGADRLDAIRVSAQARLDRLKRELEDVLSASTAD